MINAFLILFFLISSCLSLAFGSASFSIFDIFQHDHLVYQKIFFMRCLNLCQVAFAGGMLSLCGNVLQRILKNPLADPFILGISAGGTCFIALLSLFESTPLLLAINSFFPIHFFWSFFGCLFAFSLLFILKKKIPHQLDESVYPLVGIILNSLFSSVLTFCLALAGPAQLSQIHMWLMGSVEPVLWPHLIFVVCLSLPSVIFLFRSAGKIEFLSFGDDFAKAEGIDPFSFRKNLLFSVCLLISLCVCLAGPIGFVGLVVPHLVKKYCRTTVRLEWLQTFFAGASLLILADLLSRTLFSPAQVPVGAFTALIGAPVFCLILFKSRVPHE